MRDEDHKEVPDPLPGTFGSLDEAGAFWDTHSSADYEDEMEDVDIVSTADKTEAILDSLHGSVVRYDDPTESVAVEDWEALRG